jgi:hypothetical protein
MTRADSTPPDPEPESATTSVTFYIDPDLRNRTRAAFRATGASEGDAGWSDMVRKALIAELERRERRYNDGAVYVGNGAPLRAGRPAARG